MKTAADRRPPIGARLLVKSVPGAPGADHSALVTSHLGQYVEATDGMGGCFRFHVIDDSKGSNWWIAHCRHCSGTVLLNLEDPHPIASKP